MKNFSYSTNIKFGLLFIGFLLFTGILFYSQWIVERLKDNNRKIVQMYAQIIAEAVESESDENLNFIFDNIITQIQFPIIQSDALGKPQSWKNLTQNTSNLNQVKLIQDLMDQQNKPIDLVYINPVTNNKQILGYLHYGDSILIRRMQWLPYLELASIYFFIFLGLAGFTYIKKTESNNIWTGMAKETAHQLGTPVSALIGWIERLKKYPQQSEEIIKEIEEDIKRLEQVGNRFGKIGTKPNFEPVNINELFQSVLKYLNRRLSSTQIKITLDNTIDKKINLQANEILLSWAFENIIKNSLDSTHDKDGSVNVKIFSESDGIKILVSDNGSGILRRNWKKIFQPGFTTKKHGWGFGLSLSYRIIKNIHNGQIQVIGSNPNIGTTFEIYLPQS